MDLGFKLSNVRLEGLNLLDLTDALLHIIHSSGEISIEVIYSSGKPFIKVIYASGKLSIEAVYSGCEFLIEIVYPSRDLPVQVVYSFVRRLQKLLKVLNATRQNPDVSSQVLNVRFHSLAQREQVRDALSNLPR